MLCGWLSPSGEFYSCSQYGHITLANELVRKYYIKLYSARYATDEFLLNSNWLKLYTNGIGHSNNFSYTYTKKKIITDDQFSWLTNNTLSSVQYQSFMKILELESSF
ncbi:MAG: hypothetical protein IIV51_08430 [Lachnospiraceae bacterium]|uniref:hypothetical protein n=1 Tax=Falcatimonas sp. MSJ-15 TaxID=2841515 RepID=UPI001C0F6E1D|nr:hypothetical protein [Falcatimonas sp. MSJ-15]MBQ5735391.1 hypothetical protein [Lachnospiraceae bacterium]MBU5470763.1 hypothetical protein [Falcatimonas sp. MSJ-15]